jgi:hypothetical protein
VVTIVLSTVYLVLAADPQDFNMSVNPIINQYLTIYLNGILLLFNLNTRFVPTADVLPNTT